MLFLAVQGTTHRCRPVPVRPTCRPAVPSVIEAVSVPVPPVMTRPPPQPTPTPTPPQPTRTPTPTGTPPQPTRTPTLSPQPTRTPTSLIQTPPPAIQGVSAQVRGALERLLEQNNVIRRAHGLSAVTWDNELGNIMQRFANNCPRYAHGGSPDDYARGWQNLAYFDPDGSLTAAWSWYWPEANNWNHDAANNGGGYCKSGLNELMDCGHFGNMMAPAVRSIGCGVSPERCGRNRYIWCNYNNPVGWRQLPRRSISKDALVAKLEAV